MATIYDLITAQNIVDFWETGPEQPPLLCDELFPLEQQLGLKIETLKGKRGIPRVLNPSAYDVAALKIEPQQFEMYEQFMPFFKQSDDINEEVRQLINTLISSAGESRVRPLVEKVFGSLTRLLVMARTQRERMVLMMLMTGIIAITANGQNYYYDYDLEADQRKTVKKPWSAPDATILSDIESWLNDAETRSGVRPGRILLNSKTASYFSVNTEIRNAVWGNNSAAPATRNMISNYLEAELNVKYKVYDGKFRDEKGVVSNFVPDNTISIFPTGTLGIGRMGTTPEQSDLQNSLVANVAITDVGVAVTTTQVVDPVTVDTKVSMIYLPEFDLVDSLIIADVSGNTGS